MRYHKITTVAATAIILLATSPAHASGAIAGATLPEQIVQELTMVEQLNNDIQQVQQGFQSLYNQAVNMQSCVSNSWGSLGGQLQGLVDIVGKAQGLNYATQNTVSALQQQFGDPSNLLNPVSQNLQSWTKNLNSQISAVLQQYNISSKNFQSAQQALDTINNQCTSAQGRKAVQQAGNQIAGLMVNQIQSLQSDIQAANQAKLNYIAMQAAEKVQQRNSEKAWIDAPPIPGLY
ncbi:MAG: P-type conjugative transfer protein TrbJ [Thiomonas sp.]|jgi:P-type conjugative transfer protein TrbJ